MRAQEKTEIANIRENKNDKISIRCSKQELDLTR